MRRVIGSLGNRIEPITYWVMVGERVALSGTEQKLAQLFYSTRGVIPDGLLVRVSSIDVDAANAYRIQEAFVSSLTDAVSPTLRAQVVGIRAS